MDILRRFKRGSSEAGTAKHGIKSSKETVPETGQSVAHRGLDFGTKGRWSMPDRKLDFGTKGRSKIVRPLTEISASLGTRISNQVLFDGSDLMKG